MFQIFIDVNQKSENCKAENIFNDFPYFFVMFTNTYISVFVF